MNPSVIKGKIVLSTFHQVKGLERKVVIVFYFNKNYFDFFARDSADEICPNTLYVACTRATEQLYLIGEEYDGEHVQFLRNYKNSSHLKIVELSPLRPYRGYVIPQTSKYSVTNLISFLPESIVAKALSYIKLKTIVNAENLVNFQSTIETTDNLKEEVFELTGVAIPASYEALTTKVRSTIQDSSIKTLKLSSDDNETAANKKQRLKFLEEVIDEIDPKDIKKILRLAAIYSYVSSGYNNKAVQIKTYNWVTEDQLNICLDILAKYLVGSVKYEVEAEVSENFKVKPKASYISYEDDKVENRIVENNFKERYVTITGRIDAVTINSIWVSYLL